MKKFFCKLKASIHRGICNLLCCVHKTRNRAERVLAGNTGEGYIDTALKVLMAVIIGVLILGGLYALFDDTILPNLTKKSVICSIMLGDSNLYGMLLLCLLVMAAVADLHKRIVPDSTCVLIAVMGLIPFSPTRVWGLLVALPLLISAMATDRMGGGDVKLTAASGLVLGFPLGIFGLAVGLTSAVLFHAVCVVFCKFKHIKAPAAREMALPLAPFLSVGFFSAYLLNMGGITF